MKKTGEGYKIGDLASMFGLTARTIRYYEELGLLKSNDRVEGLHRRYPAKNLVYLKRIRQLKAYDLSLGEIKEFFDLVEEDPSGSLCRKLLIRKFEDKIQEERKAMAEAQKRVDLLNGQVSRLASRKSFFSCPGEECPDCHVPCDYDLVDPLWGKEEP